MAQKMGHTIIPALSTTPIVVPLPFTPSAVTLRAVSRIGPCVRRSSGMITPPAVNSLQWEHAQTPPDPCMRYSAEIDEAWNVQTIEGAGCIGTGQIGTGQFTLRPDVNEIAGVTVIHWFAIE